MLRTNSNELSKREVTQIITNKNNTTAESNVYNPSSNKIDKEHETLEKIFRISLIKKEDNYSFLKEYSLALEQEKQEKAFRIKDIDSIIQSITISIQKVFN